MPKYKVLIARFPYGGAECSESVDWLIRTSIQISHDPRFELLRGRINDTPITMTRNQVVERARQAGVDFLVMLDSDQAPDCELGADPLARPFWESTIEFMLAQKEPCLVAAPYCGPPPHENVYVFQWADLETGNVDGQGVRIVQYTREQAAVMTGIQPVCALPTGLILIDMKALPRDKKGPFFYYEYQGDGPRCERCGERARGPEARKSSTEDCTFSRDLSLGGVPLFCNWDAWAGHVKKKMVRKPRPMTADVVAARIRPAILANRHAGDRLVLMDSPELAHEIQEAEERWERDRLQTPAPAAAANGIPQMRASSLPPLVAGTTPTATLDDLFAPIRVG